MEKTICMICMIFSCLGFEQKSFSSRSRTLCPCHQLGVSHMIPSGNTSWFRILLIQAGSDLLSQVHAQGLLCRLNCLRLLMFMDCISCGKMVQFGYLRDAGIVQDFRCLWNSSPLECQHSGYNCGWKSASNVSLKYHWSFKMENSFPWNCRLYWYRLRFW